MFVFVAVAVLLSIVFCSLACTICKTLCYFRAKPSPFFVIVVFRVVFRIIVVAVH